MKRKKKSSYIIRRKYKTIVFKEIFNISRKDFDDIALYVEPISLKDNLFVESSNVNDPCLMPASVKTELYYEYGYLGTTFFLLNMIEFGKTYIKKDSYIYPALFCFRQYLENMMKVIISKYDKSGINGIGHNLDKCWEKLLFYIEDKDETVIAIGGIIHELQSVDEYATAFRYTGVLNDKFKTKTDFKSKLINVRELRTRILQTYRFFDGIYELACRKIK